MATFNLVLRIKFKISCMHSKKKITSDYFSKKKNTTVYYVLGYGIDNTIFHLVCYLTDRDVSNVSEI